LIKFLRREEGLKVWLVVIKREIYENAIRRETIINLIDKVIKWNCHWTWV